jgi:hypothetical protein
VSTWYEVTVSIPLTIRADSRDEAADEAQRIIGISTDYETSGGLATVTVVEVQAVNAKRAAS